MEKHGNRTTLVKELFFFFEKLTLPIFLQRVKCFTGPKEENR